MLRWKFVLVIYFVAVGLFIFIQTVFHLNSLNTDSYGNYESNKRFNWPKQPQSETSEYETDINDSFKLAYEHAPFNASFDTVTITKQTNFDYRHQWLVLFHIQKSSGTNLDIGLIEQIKIKKKGKWTNGCYQIKVKPKGRLQYAKRGAFLIVYACNRSAQNDSWYFSWHERSFGWKCGVHPGLSQLKGCLKNKFSKERVDNFHYFSMIRHPIKRFISEWIHAKQTGSIWLFKYDGLNPEHKCLREYFKPCTSRDRYDWEGVRLKQFIDCGERNLASNRQTRMLAEYDDTFTLCNYLNSSNQSVLFPELLERARRGLKSLNFFGLAEYQNHSMLLFEKMFNNSFRFDKPETIVNPNKPSKEKSVRLRHKTSLTTESVLGTMSNRMLKRIYNLNSLDLSLYQYAKSLFIKRLKHFKIEFKES